MEPVPHIDWVSEEKAIKASNRMTDDEVEQTLNALSQAKKKFINPAEIPERINLTDMRGHIRHTILTSDGLMCTQYVGPEYPLIPRPLMAIGTVASMILFYYFYF